MSSYLYLNNPHGRQRMTLRRLEEGERRRNGDFWADCWGNLCQLTDLKWYNAKKIRKGGWAAHYRVLTY